MEPKRLISRLQSKREHDAQRRCYRVATGSVVACARSHNPINSGNSGTTVMSHCARKASPVVAFPPRSARWRWSSLHQSAIELSPWGETRSGG